MGEALAPVYIRAMAHNPSSQPIPPDVRRHLLAAMGVDEQRILGIYLQIDPTTNVKAAESALRLLRREPDHWYGPRLYSTWMRVYYRIQKKSSSSPSLNELVESALEKGLRSEDLEAFASAMKAREEEEEEAKKAGAEALKLGEEVERLISKHVNNCSPGSYGLAIRWLLAHWPNEFTGSVADRFAGLILKYGQEVLEKARELFPE